VVTYTNHNITGTDVEYQPDTVDAVLRRFSCYFFKVALFDFVGVKYVGEEVQWQHANRGPASADCDLYVFCCVRGSTQKLECACVDIGNSWFRQGAGTELIPEHGSPQKRSLAPMYPTLVAEN
jgi:hypothetical protein